jgi:MoxR-like ATPase
MIIRINAAELLKILEMTPAEQNIMLAGNHGIGKSEIVEKFFTGRSQRVVVLFLGQMSDPGDLIGLPARDSKTNKTEFLPPWWFPADNKPVVLFLDELNRARPEILQAVMDLALNKTLAGRKLPDGSRVIAAVNEGDEYQLTQLDPALVSRFNVYQFSPTQAEWLLWAAENHLDSRIIDFIGENPDCLDGVVEDTGSLEKNADRRSWRRVSEVISTIEKTDSLMEKIIAGIVGITAAMKFFTFLKNRHNINAKIVLSGFAAVKKQIEKLDAHELTVLNEGTFRIIEVEEEETTLIRYINNLEHYIRWLKTSGKNEVLAHWTTLYESAAYPKAKVAILSHSNYIFQNIVEFIKELEL